MGAAELDVSGAGGAEGEGSASRPRRLLSVIPWRGLEVREHGNLREPPDRLSAGGASLAFGEAAEERVLKGQLLPAPLHPKGTSACEVSPSPPRVDRFPGEEHERIPRSGSLEGCTSGCAKLASPLFTHLGVSLGPGNCSLCLQGARFLPPPADKGGVAKASKTLLLGPPAGTGRKAAEMRPKCRMAWRSG